MTMINQEKSCLRNTKPLPFLKILFSWANCWLPMAGSNILFDIIGRCQCEIAKLGLIRKFEEILATLNKYNHYCGDHHYVSLGKTKIALLQ